MYVSDGFFVNFIFPNFLFLGLFESIYFIFYLWWVVCWFLVFQFYNQWKSAKPAPTWGGYAIFLEVQETQEALHCMGSGYHPDFYCIHGNIISLPIKVFFTSYSYEKIQNNKWKKGKKKNQHLDFFPGIYFVVVVVLLHLRRRPFIFFSLPQPTTYTTPHHPSAPHHPPPTQKTYIKFSSKSTTHRR